MMIFDENGRLIDIGEPPPPRFLTERTRPTWYWVCVLIGMALGLLLIAIF